MSSAEPNRRSFDALEDAHDDVSVDVDDAIRRTGLSRGREWPAAPRTALPAGAGGARSSEVRT